MPEKSLTISGKKHFISNEMFIMWKETPKFNEIIALHIQADLPSLLGAPEHMLQHCWGNCMHCCQNVFTQVLQMPNLHLSHDVTP